MLPNPPAAPVLRRDIETPEDVIQLVDTFYGKVLRDPLISHFFRDVAQIDLEHHLPKMYRFWCSLILGMPSYQDNAFLPHIALHQKSPLDASHFARWLELFFATVDDFFEGPGAELAKKRASTIAGAMRSKLSHLGADAVE